MRTRTYKAVVVLLAASASPVHGQAPQAGFSTFGMPGLIDMPTARVLPDGSLGVTLMAMPGSQRATLSFQALPRVTLSFRYSTITEWEPGFRLFDRSLDLHWQIMDEGRYLPAFALGLRDFMGTGAYSGEYIVATRSLGPRLEASLGMGWGRLASHGGFSNPPVESAASRIWSQTRWLDRNRRFGRVPELLSWRRGAVRWGLSSIVDGLSVTDKTLHQVQAGQDPERAAWDLGC